jgi:hypothetical protein
MNCQETRQRLSRLADKELRDEELKAVRGHLAECPSCRRELDEQGALDMLLKSRYETELRDSDLASLWPQVAERLDAPGEGKPQNGGGSRPPEEGEIVFKSSSAMQMLNIPERRVEAAPRAVGEPVAPPPQASAWRWPAAFVLGAALIAGGLIYMKQTSAPDPGAARASAEAPPPTIGPAGAASQPASQPTAVALATPTEAGAAPAEPGAGTSAEEKARPGAKAAAKRAKARSKEEEGKSEKSPEPKAEPSAKVAAKPAAKAGKKDELDSLIDNVIGDDTPKKKAAAAPKPEPGSDLPEQLDMNQIRNAMNKVKGHVQSCYDQFQVEGMAKVTFTISPDGSVQDASIKGKFFGTDTGTCVVAAVKKARFPKFRGKPMTIPNYPFLLQ